MQIACVEKEMAVGGVLLRNQGWFRNCLTAIWMRTLCAHSVENGGSLLCFRTSICAGSLLKMSTLLINNNFLNVALKKIISSIGSPPEIISSFLFLYIYIYKEGLEWAFLTNETLDELFS
jgi:hypothetical protein